MSRNLTSEPVATGSAETRIGQLRWREYGDPHEAAGERTLLFVHGLLTNSDVWGEVVQNLSQDFRCITLDIPLGSHTIPRPRRCSPHRCRAGAGRERSGRTANAHTGLPSLAAIPAG